MNQKVSLNLLLDTIKSNLNKNSTEIISYRAVKNQEKVDASIYFTELNEFLTDKHPDCFTTIINQVFHDN